MKLPDFTKSLELNLLKRKMGIPDHVLGDLPFVMVPGAASKEEEIALESNEGLEISIGDVDVLEDGTLAYKNRRIILYIRDKITYGGTYDDPRFHVSSCSVIRRMQSEGKIDRYVCYSKDSGEFQINVINGRSATKMMKRLLVCQPCLDYLSYGSFSIAQPSEQRLRAVKKFSIKSFFEEHPKSFHVELPRYSVQSAPLNVYSADFLEISQRVRKARGWLCEAKNCGLDLSRPHHREYRRYLHVHHKDGAKYNNSEANLEVLCLYCHSEQPNHYHMKALPEYKQFLKIRQQLIV